MTKNILTVDDEIGVSYTVKHGLEDLDKDYNVTCVDSAQKCFEFLENNETPDLILLDMLLPRENGVFFLEKLRKSTETKTIPVLVFSNYDDPETKKKTLNLGIEGYLIKTNYTPQEVVEKIKTHLK